MEEKKRWRYSTHLKIFITCFVMILVGILPVLIKTKGIFLSYADCNVQNIPFWFYYRDKYLSGFPDWDWRSGLGMSFLPSYTFYGVTSPYALLTLLFPGKSLMYGLNVIFALKFAFSGLFAYIYIRRYTRTDNSAFIGAMLYAFCGAQVFDIVYHFNESLSLFPLLLWGFDKLIHERKAGIFAISLALTGFTNYYFLFGSCIFIALYFFVKLFTKEIKLDSKLFFMLALESLGGVLLTACVLLPSYLALAGNPRSDNSIFDQNLLAYKEQGVVLNLISSAFFIPNLCGVGNFFADRQISLVSVSLYLPLFTMVGVISVIRREKGKKSWYVVLSAVCAVIAVIPVLNSAFSAFNASYYARWLYMPSLILAMMTAKYLDDFDTTDIKTELKISLGVVAFYCAYGTFLVVKAFTLPKTNIEKQSAGILPDNLLNTNPFMLIFIMVAALCELFILYLLKNPEKAGFAGKVIKREYLTRITALICIVPLLRTSIVVGVDDAEDDVNKIFNGGYGVTIDGGEDARVINNSVDVFNSPMMWGFAHPDIFNSCTPPSVTDFYAYAGLPRFQCFMVDRSYYALPSLISTKYDLFYNQLMVGGVEVEPEHIPVYRYGYEMIDVQNRYIIYENKNYIPMGFTYDYYLPLNDFPAFRPEISNFYTIDGEETIYRQRLMLRSIWLTDEQIEKYGGSILEKLPEDMKKDTVEFSSYEKDCADRRATAGYEFTPNDKGFTSRIKLERDNLVFYSVPYDTNMKAYVDGAETEIEMVFGGLSAVFVPEGDHEIRFVHETPGLRTGVIVSIISAGVIAVYMLAVFAVRHKGSSKGKGKKDTEAPENE